MPEKAEPVTRNDRPTDRAGLLAGRYRLGRILGSGGAGIVREGEDTLLRRPVAIKHVRLPPVASDEELAIARERVLREARVAARLRHPGLVAVYDVIESEGSPWIVMELVEGRSLAEVIREEGRLAPAVVARMGVSLAYALEAAHRSGVVHRDVKPGNVLVTPEGQPRLTDFGIAVSEGDPALTSTGIVVGSPAYIPPERARGSRVAAPGDVWGLGATLFTAVEGESPYAGEGALATLAAIVEDRRRPFRYAGPLGPVLAELLNPDPRRRPSLSQARVLLRRIADAEPGPARGLDGHEPERVDQEERERERDDDRSRNRSRSHKRDLAGADRRDADRGDAGHADVDSRSHPAAFAGAAQAQDADVPAAEGRVEPLLAATVVEAGAGAVPVRTGRRSSAGGRGRGPSDLADPFGRSGSPDGSGRRWSRRVTVLVLVLVALLAIGGTSLGLVLTSGSGDTDGGTTARPSATAAPTPGATAGSGGGEAAPTPAASGSAPPATTPAPAGDAVPELDEIGAVIPSSTEPVPAPAGLATHRGAAGWSVAVPGGWQYSRRSPTRELFAAPGGFPELLVETQAAAGPSAIGAWQQQEPSVRRSTAGYQLVSIRPADGGAGTTAAIWEFTSTSNGRTVHTVDYAVVRNGHGYALRWRIPAEQWDPNSEVLRQIIASFRPGP
ncbi:serine/threonine protein kinase [Parafrankia colletiae]|uniref:non-specific serine/threonine protein kinase n=1 Tax=Parafrankia colletiae TaxID=573497 RepID=A0A1S1QHR0_9ACTN|nr:serine/threonine protein kinase [Parafrankia colletiae]